MAKRYILDRQQNYLIPFVFEITSFKTNSGTETITVNSGYNVATSINGSGFITEQNSYIFSGEVRFNKATAIGTIKIEAPASSFISRSPFLKGNFGNNIKLVLAKIEKLTTGKLTKRTNVYTFNLYYRSKEKTRLEDGLKAELVYSSAETGYRDFIIDQIKTGLEPQSNIIPLNGSASHVKIYGEPGSSFGLVVNKYPLDVEVKEDGSTATGRLINNKVNAISILDDNVANSTTTFYGKKLNIVKGKIGNNGVYKFLQVWPDLPNRNSLASAASSTHTITLLDSVDGIEVGDNVKLYGLSTIPTVHSIVSTTLKQIRLSSTVTLAEGTKVEFQRRIDYGVEILPDLSSALSEKIPTSRGYTLEQIPDVLITFKTSTATTDFTITHEIIGSQTVDRSSGSGDGDDPYLVSDKTYSAFSTTPGEDHTYSICAKVDAKRVYIPIRIKLKLLGNGGKTFSATRVPVFNNLVGTSITQPGTPATAQQDGGSDWTNSIGSANGGTGVVGLTSELALSTVSAANDTCELSLGFNIVSVGRENVTLELDLDKILTATTP